MIYKLELHCEGDLQAIAKIDLQLADLRKMPGVTVVRWAPFTPKKPKKPAK